jgi:hypothetical protein
MAERMYHKVLHVVVDELLHSFFGGLHFVCTSLQKALLGLAQVQEVEPVRKKYFQLNIFINKKNN